jgi:hypothetical protein
MAILTKEDGLVAKTPLDAEQAVAAGYVKCPTMKNSGGNVCNFHLSPETQSSLQQNHGYFTCPSCHFSYDFLHELPWHGVTDMHDIEDAHEQDRQDSKFGPGGGTRIGIPMSVQAQIGEDLVEEMGEIPGYGKIDWWHDGGATSPSPLDGSTHDWGVEVKTIGYDATHHRFVPGRPSEKEDKNAQAAQLGKQGTLGVLVLLDYRRSVADVFVRPYPAEKGVGSFRSSQGATQHLVKEIPFKNPLLDPHDPTPHVVNDNEPPF